MDPTKNHRGRSKLFTCFKPVVDGDHDLGGELVSPPSPGEDSGGRRKRRIRRSFSAALKVAFRKASSLKKSRSENSMQDFDRPSRNNIISKSKKIVKSVKKNLSCNSFWEQPQEIFRTKSNRSSLFSSNSSRRTASSMSSSSISSISSNLGSESERIKRSVSLDFKQLSPIMDGQKSMKRSSSDCGKKYCICIPNLEMSIFLVCLVCLVFWGKVFAIVTCTSTWFFFAPACPGNRFRGAHSLVDDVVVVDSDEYKKKVIMEGMLERNRSRVFQV